MAFTKEDLNRYLYDRGWEPVETSQVDFHNYRRIANFGAHNYAILSVCLQPNIFQEYEDPRHLYEVLFASLTTE